MKYLLPLLLLTACAQPDVTWSKSGSPTPDIHTDPVYPIPGNSGSGECTTPVLTAEDIKNLCSKECDITEHYGYVIHMKGSENIGEGCFCKKKLIPHHEDNENFLERKKTHPKIH